MVIAGGLVARILSVHELLDSLGVTHQFGGAIALAWYRRPRATTDIDLNLTVRPADAEPVLRAVEHLGVTVSAADRAAVREDGQARLRWQDSYLDVFFATFDLHDEMATEARAVQLEGVEIPILSPEHLVVCKAVYDRPKDWIDIEAMAAWGTDIDSGAVLGWVCCLLGDDAPQVARLRSILGS
jgi:hypothetical protein